MTIDINSDLGEGAGHDDEVLAIVTSANISCGFHAGDPGSILACIQRANEHGVAVGAHPSFPDRENFGRTEMKMAAGLVFSQVLYQLGAFAALCVAADVRLNHVKPHGALYNMAARDRELAQAIAHAVLAIDRRLLVFAPAGSDLDRAARALGLVVVPEVFADRNYLSNGELVPRSRPDALITDPAEAAARATTMVREQRVRAVDGSMIVMRGETICVHGDNARAVEFARALKTSLQDHGIVVGARQRGS